MNRHIYLNNTSLILVLDIKKSIDGFKDTTINLSEDDFVYSCVDSWDERTISKFYNDNGRKEYTEKFVRLLFNHGSSFHSIRKENVIVAGMWIHSRYLFLNDPSFYAFQTSRQDAVEFCSDVIYSGHNYVLQEYRGLHLFTTLVKKILEHYKDTKKYYMYMTSISSQQMIGLGMKHNATLVSIVNTRCFFSTIWKKITYYTDKDRIWWKQIDHNSIRN